jgi:hypothetical protein
MDNRMMRRVGDMVLKLFHNDFLASTDDISCSLPGHGNDQGFMLHRCKD